MISVICLTRNAPQYASACLQSLRACAQTLKSAGTDAEFILADDCSDEERATLPALRSFRDSVDAATTIIRFRRRMHYAHGLAHTISLARGDNVLFVSQDMVVPPDCLLEMLELASLDPTLGVIRPTSGHMDWADALSQEPPSGGQTFIERLAFSADVRRRMRGTCTVWPMLIGDAMLVQRSVLDRIGVFDTRFYGFFADVDYGVRLYRAGFRHIIARGAWLHHEGAGTARETAATGGKSVEDDKREMLRDVDLAYTLFRQKWNHVELPPCFRDLNRDHFDRLNTPPPLPDRGDFQPPLTLSPETAEMI